MSQAWRVCAAGSAVLVVSGRLHAQELGPTLLSYRAGENCPEVAEFQRSVQRRSAHLHFVDEGTHERELSIALSKDHDATIGELRLIDRDGGVRQRKVRFTTCAEAVEGLALITAVSLDPQSLLEPAPPAATASQPPVAATPDAPRAVPAAPSPQRAPATPRTEPALEVALGAAFSTAYRALPANALGGTLFVDAASSSRSGLSPLFRTSVGHVERRALAELGSKASFALTVVTLSACPVWLGGKVLVVRPCAFASGGALRSWGAATTDPLTRTRPYGAWGGSLVVFVMVSQAFEIVGDTALGSPLLRDSFRFAQRPFWTTPALYLWNDVGLRFVFR